MTTLASYLEEEGITYVDFAEDIGCHPATIHKILSGEREPGRKMREAIYLGSGGHVTYNDLYPIPELTAALKRRRSRQNN